VKLQTFAGTRFEAVTLLHGSQNDDVGKGLIGQPNDIGCRATGTWNLLKLPDNPAN
jgi:hypothetical protein